MYIPSIYMEIIFYKFSKRKNSTKQAFNGVSYKHGTLKDFCSITKPVILVDMGKIPDYNYAYITEFKRYYYITNVVVESGTMCRVYMAVDVLASYKDDILKADVFVQRWSRSDVIDIMDGQCVARANPEQRIETGVLPIDSDGHFVLGVTGKNGANAVAYYDLNKTQLELLMNFLFTEDNFKDVISEEVVKSFFNPFDFIVSCMWFPFPHSPANKRRIDFGWFSNDEIMGVLLEGNSLTSGELWVTIPRMYPKGDFRNSAFISYKIYIPFFGEIPIDANIISKADVISYKFVVDIATGKAQCQLGYGDFSIMESGSGTVFMRLEGQMGCPIALAQTNTDIIGGAVSAIGSVAGFLKNPQGAVEGVVSAVENAMPVPEIKSGNGCRSTLDFERNVKLTATMYRANVLNPEDRGYIYCKRQTLGSLGGGFAICDNASIPLSATEEEIAEVNNYVNGGIYIE